MMMMGRTLPLPSKLELKLQLKWRSIGRRHHVHGGGLVIYARDRNESRKQLQRGRYLSIEAIQTIQSLKRAQKNTTINDSQALLDYTNFRRLLKFDMIAVLRELLRQNQCQLSLLVFEDVRKEHWYKPQASLYAEMISVLGSNKLFEQVELIFSIMKTENSLEAKTEDLNALLRSLISFNMTGLAMECFYLMKSVADRSTFRILIIYLESSGETTLSESMRLEAQECYGECLDFLEEQEEVLQQVNRYSFE